MKKILGSVAMAGLLVIAASTARASDPCISGTGTSILTHWGANGFSYEGPNAYTNYMSPAGNILTNVTSPDLLCGPLAGLVLNDPGYEITMVWSGLVSGGTVYTPLALGSGKYVTAYTGGTFAIYQGPVNARGYNSGTVPAPGIALPQYAEGTVLLSGTMSVTTTINYSGLTGAYSGSFRGSYQITGGTLIANVCPQGANPGAGLMDGLWDPNVPPTGYTGHNNGKFDMPDCQSVPVRHNTWGRLKVQYR
jgi:hypothetical protein